MNVKDTIEYKLLLIEVRELQKKFGDSEVARSKACELFQFEADYNLFPEFFKLTLDGQITN